MDGCVCMFLCVCHPKPTTPHLVQAPAWMMNTCMGVGGLGTRCLTDIALQ